MNLLNKTLFSTKNFLINEEIKIFYFFLCITIFKSFSHFIKKNILGDRIDFWDFHVYWCTANKFLNGENPYGGKIIKDCLSQFNFDLYFSYPPIILKSILFLGYFDIKIAKFTWILILLISFFIIIWSINKTFFQKRNFLFLQSIIIIFSFGGVIWSALMAGNISIILYAILSFGLYQLIRKKNNIFYLSVSLVSLAKFPFMIFFFLPLFLYGYKEFKRITFFFFLVFLIYYFQYYFDKELFMSFINSTKTYKSDNFLLIHGTGIGIHGNIDLLQNLIFSKSDIELFKPSGYFSFLLHLFISLILFLSAFFLFPRTKKMNYKQIKLLVSFYIIVFLCCFPRISSYDFFLIIPSFLYIFNNSNIRKINNFWKLFSTIIIIASVSVYDSKLPSLILSLTIFTCLYLQIIKKDPFKLEKKLT